MDDNTWEPISNLDCPDNIANYEKEKRKIKEEKLEKKNIKIEKKVNRPHFSIQATLNFVIFCYFFKLKVEPPPVSGFERKFEPEKIIGASNDTGELMFLMKW